MENKCGNCDPTNWKEFRAIPYELSGPKERICPVCGRDTSIKEETMENKCHLCGQELQPLQPQTLLMDEKWCHTSCYYTKYGQEPAPPPLGICVSDKVGSKEKVG